MCRQRGSKFVVGNDRQIDEKPKDTCAQEGPETNRYQEHDGPIVRERGSRFDSWRAPSWRKLHASTLRNVNGMTSAAEKNAPRAMCSAGVPEKYRWCIVPIT